MPPSTADVVDVEEGKDEEHPEHTDDDSSGGEIGQPLSHARLFGREVHLVVVEGRIELLSVVRPELAFATESPRAVQLRHRTRRIARTMRPARVPARAARAARANAPSISDPSSPPAEVPPETSTASKSCP